MPAFLASRAQLLTRVAALYFIGGVRVTFSTGIAAGGNLAYWSAFIPSFHVGTALTCSACRTSFIVTCVFTFITAAVIAETCSSLPLAGSIYLWAAEAGGPRFGRLFGFVVAWWSTTAWTTFCASMFSWSQSLNQLTILQATPKQQSTTCFLCAHVFDDLSLLSLIPPQEIVVFNVDFPSDASSVKFRAVQWICTEIMLAMAAIANLLPREWLPSITTHLADQEGSPLLPLGVLCFLLHCRAGLRHELDLATDWHQKHVRIPLYPRCIHDDLQRHRRSSRLELVSFLPRHRRHPDWF